MKNRGTSCYQDTTVTTIAEEVVEEVVSVEDASFIPTR